MKTIVLENFRYGLDTRRSAISSSLGTLTTLENGFVNQGAEIESRKAFVKLGTLAHSAFDLVATPAGLVSFRSKGLSLATTARTRSFGNVVQLTLNTTNLADTFTNGDLIDISGVGGTGYNLTQVAITGVLGNAIQYTSAGPNEGATADVGGTVTLSTLGGAISYQRLTHPWETLINDDLLNPAMIGTTASGCFNGKTFVAATFSAFNGSIISGDFSTPAGTILFYDGTPVVQHWLGSVLITSGHNIGSPSDQLIQMATALATELPSYFGTDYTGQYVALTIGGVTQAYTTITGPANQDFTLTPSYVTSTTKSLTLDPSLGAAAKDPVTATGATTSLFFVAGTAGSINTLQDGNLVSLILGAVNYNQSLLQTIIDLATVINARSGTTGYTATASLVSTNKALLVVTATTTDAAAFNGLALNINTTTIKVATTDSGAGIAGNSSYTFNGGITAVGATSQVSYVIFGGTVAMTQWNFFDTWKIILVANNIRYTIGGGNIVNTVPSYCLALGSKMYFCAAGTFYFSAVSDPTKWEAQDSGAGFQPAFDQTFSPSDVVSLANYQGKLAVFCQHSIQIYNVNADPTLMSQAQNIQNIGCLAKLTTQSIGEEDVMFLSSSGIRSLRVRETSLNAIISDIGSPVDNLITAALNSAGVNTAAFAIVEPTSNTYWLFIKGTFYVLSYFPTLKITAWSTFKPTYYVNGVLTTFVPVKAVVYNNQIYLLADNNDLFLYGGLNNNTYDGSVVTVETPWLDDKMPSKNKGFVSTDLGISGKWTLSAGCDPISGTLETIAVTGDPATPNSSIDSTYDKLMITYIANGTHFRMRAVSDVANVGIIKLSTLSIKYEPQDEK